MAQPASYAGGFCAQASLRASDNCVRAALAAAIALATAVAGTGWASLPSRTEGQRALPAPAVSAAMQPAGQLPLDAAVALLGGDWVQERGVSRIVITRSGRVWSDLGQMQGRIKPVALPGADLVFGDDHFFCAYRITFEGQERANWHLAESSSGTPCPSGIFRRTPGVTL